MGLFELGQIFSLPIDSIFDKKIYEMRQFELEDFLSRLVPPPLE